MISERSGEELPRFRVPIIDVSVTNAATGEFLAWLANPSDRRRLVVHHNLHSVYLFHTVEGFAEFYDGADVINIDGFPIFVAALMANRFAPASTRPHRLENIDWIPGLASASSRVAVIGGTSAGNAELVRLLRSRGAMALGWDGFSGREQLSETDFAELSDFRPEVVLVGMGMPLQEQFLREHWLRLPAATYVTVGAAIDQLGGADRHAPKWMRKVGLAWAWRLGREPRRMWRRYLLEPLLLMSVLWRKRRGPSGE